MTSIGDKLSSEWQHLTHHDQEHTVTTPQPPQSALSDTLHAMAADISANRFAAYLLEHRIGTSLARTDAEHVIALIQSLEAAQGQVLTYAAPADGGAVRGFLEGLAQPQAVFRPSTVHTPDGGTAEQSQPTA